MFHGAGVTKTIVDGPPTSMTGSSPYTVKPYGQQHNGYEVPNFAGSAIQGSRPTQHESTISPHYLVQEYGYRSSVTHNESKHRAIASGLADGYASSETRQESLRDGFGREVGTYASSNDGGEYVDGAGSKDEYLTSNMNSVIPEMRRSPSHEGRSAARRDSQLRRHR